MTTLGGGGGGGGKNLEVSQYSSLFPNQIPMGEVVNFFRGLILFPNILIFIVAVFKFALGPKQFILFKTLNK